MPSAAPYEPITRLQGYLAPILAGGSACRVSRLGLLYDDFLMVRWFHPVNRGQGMPAAGRYGGVAAAGSSGLAGGRGGRGAGCVRVRRGVPGRPAGAGAV